MGFLDKVKSVTEQAAARAKEEVQELQAKRELAAAYGDLGKTAFDLAEKGELSNPALTGGVERIRKRKAELEAMVSSGATAPAGEPAEPAPPS